MAYDMHGKFFMSDVYGGVWGTTEMTIPEAQDKQALVDDHDAEAHVEATSTSSTKGIIGAVILIVCAALFLGAMK